MIIATVVTDKKVAAILICEPDYHYFSALYAVQSAINYVAMSTQGC